MDLKELYRDVILDHNKRPRNFGVLAPPAASARGHNPLCGDQLTIYAKVEDGIIKELKFEGSGCAISVASASLMTEALTGKTLGEADALYTQIHALLTHAELPNSTCTAELGKLAALSGVREFPARVKCASLCWHTLQAALNNPTTSVCTE
jgi:nitrogen fixation NifU-like protein